MDDQAQGTMDVSLNRFVVALAISIVKVKPDDLPVSEHIDNLRRTCLLRWQKHGTNCIAQSLQLQDTIVELEGRLQAQDVVIRSLKQQQRQLNESLDLSKDEHLIAFARNFTPFDAGACVKTVPSTCLDNPDPESKQYRRTIVQIVLKIESLLQSEAQCDHAELVHYLLQIPVAILKLLKASLHKETANTAPLEKQQANMTAYARAISVLLQAAARLDTQSQGDLARQVTYVMVDFFRQLLDILEASNPWDVALHCHDNPDPHSMSKASSRAHNQAGCNEDCRRTTNEEHRLLCAFIVHILHSLFPTVSVHQNMFKGFMTVVLARVGRRLYHAVFGHDKSNTIEQDIRALGRLGPSTRGKPPDADGDSSAALVSILEQVLTLAPTFNSQPVDHHSTSIVLEAVKQKLQHTLIEAIFNKSPTDQLDNLEGGLVLMPIQQLEPASVPSTGSMNEAHWLQQEVWRVIGWEVLAQ